MPDRSMRRFNLVVLIAAALVGTVAGVFAFARLAELPRQQRAASRLVEHTLEVLGAASVIEADIQTLTSEVRGYFITRTADMRARFEASIQTVGRDITGLRALTADNPVQTQALDRLAALNAERVATLRAISDRLAAGDEAGAMARSRTYNGQAALDEIIAVLHQIQAEERHLLAARTQASESATRRATFALIGCGLIVAVSWLLLFLLFARQRARRLAGLARVNAELEEQVARRTAELAASAARQRSYFDNSPVGKVVMQFRADGELIYEDMNSVYAAVCGCSRERAIGRTLREVWPEPVARAAEERARACARSGRNTHYSVVLERDGSQRFLELDLAPMRDEAGESKRVLVCVHDVTEQHELERELIAQAEREAEAAEREMALFRNSADVLFVVRVEPAPGGHAFFYEAFSPSLEKTTGWRAADLIGKGPDATLPPAAAQTVLATYRRCIETGTTVSYSTVYQTPFGRREYDGSITPVRHSTSGEIVRLVGALHDVTQRNLMQETLHQAQKMEAIGRLAAGVAHDFNNILQTIFSGLELAVAESSAAGTGFTEFAMVALRAAKRGAYLTNHLLCYARKQILQPRSIALPSLLSEIEQLLMRTLGPHITVRVRVDEATPQVFADAAQLETALLNLAINASHAMPNGGVLAIEARAVTDFGQRWAAITVTDSGIGMDEATLAQATEPFFTTKGLEGTGLGLSMVQGFAEQSGGRLYIASRPGEGTSVELRLPAATEMPAGEPQNALTAPAHARTSCILLVDDDPDVLMTVGAFLQKDGFRVIKAPSGNRALQVLATEEAVDAIVTDYAMPGMNGSDLIAEARLVRPDLPAVVISGFVDVHRPLSNIAGTITLRKPFHREALTQAVKCVINASEDSKSGLCSN